MPIDLKKLAVAAPVAPVKVDVTELVAEPFRAPKEWQSHSPPEMYPSRWKSIGMSADLERILKLPRRPQLDPTSERAEALIELMTARWSRGERACACAELDPQIKAGKRQCLKRLNALQAWSLYEIGIAGGLLGFLSVGSGKTVLDILSILAFAEYDPKVRNGLLLVPPNLVEQLHHEYLLLREHFVVPEIWFHNGTGAHELAPGMPVLHVRPYSLLSRTEHSDWIRNLAPQVIIADEADKLRIVNGAGSSRIMRQFFERGDTLFAGWSGSFMNASLLEWYHLAAIALRYSSPTPLDRVVCEEWDRAVGAHESLAPPGELLAFCAPGEHVRAGFGRRLAETMGVVISTGASVAVELTVEERTPPPIPQAVQDALTTLRTTWTRLDGEEFIDAMSVAECARQYACGLHLQWWFPNGEPESLIKEWKLRRKDYNKEARVELLDRREFLDSPKNLEFAAQRFHGQRDKRDDRPEWESYAWVEWSKIKDKVHPKTRPVWIDDWLARDAAEWATTHRGIVWYGIVEFGRMVAEIAGLPLHGGGPDAGVRLLGGTSKKTGKSYRGEDGSRSVICSIDSHHRGRDGLQRMFRHQLIANMLGNAASLEQLFGRLRRQGQTEDVFAEYYGHTEELQAAMTLAIRRAQCIQGLIPGNTQQLLEGMDLDEGME